MVNIFKFPNRLGLPKLLWSILFFCPRDFSDTTAILRHHASLWPGYYQVALEITDQQGKVCGDVQLLDVVVCTCDAANTACLGTSTDTRSTFGPLGVLMLLLGLLLLLCESCLHAPSHPLSG